VRITAVPTFRTPRGATVFEAVAGLRGFTQRLVVDGEIPKYHCANKNEIPPLPDVAHA